MSRFHWQLSYSLQSAQNNITRNQFQRLCCTCAGHRNISSPTDWSMATGDHERPLANTSYNMHACTHARTHTTMSGTTRVGRYQKKHSPTHTHHDHQTYFTTSSTMIYSILLVQCMCLTVLFHNLSPGPLWSSSWFGDLYFISHAFLTQSPSSFHNTCPYHCNRSAVVQYQCYVSYS